MNIISIVCAKGGTGKTTTTYNLGAALAVAGKRVLLADNDPQASLTKALGFVPEQLPVTLATLMCQAIDTPSTLQAYAEQAILHTDKLDLLPANKKLAGVTTRLAIMQSTQTMFSEPDAIDPAFVLRSVLAAFRERYDYILVDCGPHPDLQMINVLAASDRVIIPVQAHYLDAEGLPDTLEIVRRIRQTYQPNLSVSGILLTMFKPRTILARAVREQIEQQFGAKINVFGQPIDYSIRVAEHPAYGESLLDYAPECHAAIAYNALAQEVLQNGKA